MNRAGNCGKYVRRKSKSLCRSSGARLVLGTSVILAPSELAMVLLSRAVSRALKTSLRMPRSLSHDCFLFSSRPVVNESLAGKRAMWTLSGSDWDFGRNFQISSEVKTRIGAARRTRALLIFHTAVCAERRDLFLGALV